MKRTSPSSRPGPSLDQTGKRSVKEVEKLLSQLSAVMPRDRDLAAAYLGDLLEADQIHGNLLGRVVHVLTDSALVEKDSDARESMFSALVDAGSEAPVESGRIADALDQLDKDCLEYALILLGWSGKLEYKDRISRYLHYSDETIRQTAADALVELDAKTLLNGKN